MPSTAEAIEDVKAGDRLLVGGFGTCGIPLNLIEAVAQRKDLKDLTLVSNDCGTPDWGLGELVHNKQIKRLIASYVGENKEAVDQYLKG